MASEPVIDQALRQMRAITRGVHADLEGLSAEAWAAPTNCPPWAVRDLVAHMITSADGHRVSVERGVAGNVEPPQVRREDRSGHLESAAPAALIAELDRSTEQFAALYERLTSAQLDAICYHRRGNRSARWYASHRLAEVAFHAWDLRRSLGREAVLDEDVAAFLLPTLIESNLPRIYPLGPRGEGRFALSVTGAPDLRWLLSATPEQLDVQRGSGHADTTIAAPASTLALLVYGRVSVPAELSAGHLTVQGDRALAERFHFIFPNP